MVPAGVRLYPFASMISQNSLFATPAPSAGAPASPAIVRAAGESKKKPDAPAASPDSRLEQAETLTEQANTRTEQANTRTEEANTRTKEADSRTDQANTRTEQAELRSEQAAVRSVQAILASELRYRRLFETAQDGILILDAESGQVVDANPFMKDLLGYSQEEFLGRKLWEIGPFKGNAASKIAFGGLQHQDRLHYEGLPLETKDGRRVEVEFISNAYFMQQKRLIQCNIRDITERKASETALVRLAAMVESSDDAIIGTDLNSIITSWNKGAEKVFGYTAGEMLGTSILRVIPPDRLDEEKQILAQIKRGESLDHFETLRLAKDGRPIDVSVMVSPIKDATGHIVGVSKVARDVTERKVAGQTRQLNVELEQRVAERTAQLLAANQELQAFSYSVSHDLRAPLRHVMGFVELLQKDAGPALSEKSLRYLTTIFQAAKRMGILIDDLLAFSRVGREELQKTAVNLNELVRETLGDFQAETNGRILAWNIHPLPSVRADRALLRMVLVNLISNAVKFTGGRAEAQIEIGDASAGQGETVIFIRDNGAGFDPRYTDKLFGVFQRLHSQEEFEGTGIGLANVRRIIHRHGGRVWAEGVVDGGATFYFSIPTPASKA
jgi:PAS domain S-box-containing protein